MVEGNPLGFQLAFRFNTLHKPFDNTKIRQALDNRRSSLLQGVQSFNLGQFYLPFAMRKTVNGVIKAPVTVFWNVEKGGG